MNDFLKIAEELDWSYNVDDTPNERGEVCVELEKYSPQEQDFIVSIWFETDNECDFADKLEEYWRGFDPSEEAINWVGTAKMELACTIREIMRERGILSKELKNPVKCSDGLFEAVLIETNGKDTAIPTITLRMMSYKRVVKRVSPMDFEMDFESLARIAYELNDELES